MSRPSLPYLPGLDGLRAIAVIAVLLYHGQDVGGIGSWLKPQGGFLGVEVFFVLSGFLITALLVREHEAKETIGLKQFWVRRGRRLLPALYTFLAGTVVLAALFGSDALDKIRREIVGALLYFSNWLLIATDESYFEAAGRPSLLRHLWSLAIEEQFYLLWPLIVFAGLRFLGRRGLFVITLAGAAASTAWMWILFDRVEQYGDVTEVYYRTDARAGALLVGAALALIWSPWSSTSSPSASSASASSPSASSPTHAGTDGRSARRWALDVAGVAALALVIAMQYAFTDRLIEWASYVRLYHGGFLVLSLATAIVIAAVATPESRLGWALGNPAMRWLGTRSYGIYLWHWPVFQLTRPRLDVDIDGYLLLGMRLAITLALTEASYQLVEQPIRERRFLHTARTPRGILVATFTALAMIAATVGVAYAVPTIDRSPTDEVAGASLANEELAEEPALTTPTVVPTPEPTPEPTPTVSAEAAALIVGDFDPTELEQPTPAPTPTQPPLPPPPPLTEPFDIASSRIHIVGDSVIEGARGSLSRISPAVSVDGRTGRQWWELPGELRQMRAQGLANDVVVIQLGNNGNFTTEMFDSVMNALSGTRLVVFINIHAPVLWEAEVNAMLARNVNRYPEQARLIDWYTASRDHPEYFVEDGTHLAGDGIVALRLLIESALVILG